MTYTESYKEHIIHTFNAYCKVVIRNAAITAWRNQQRQHKREISLEYLTEEKFYPLGTTDEYFEAPYEEYPVTICAQTIILTNGKLAAALLSLPKKNREIIFFYFFGNYRQWEIGEMYGRCRSTIGYQIHRTLKLLRKEIEMLSHGESETYDSNIRIVNDFTVWFLKKAGFEWNEIDREYMRGYINYFHELGYLEV